MKRNVIVVAMLAIAVVAVAQTRPVAPVPTVTAEQARQALAVLDAYAGLPLPSGPQERVSAMAQIVSAHNTLATFIIAHTPAVRPAPAAPAAPVAETETTEETDG